MPVDEHDGRVRFGGGAAKGEKLLVRLLAGCGSRAKQRDPELVLELGREDDRFRELVSDECGNSSNHQTEQETKSKVERDVRR